VCWLAGAPAPWLTGSVAATAAAALAGFSIGMPNWLRAVAFVFLGANMGSTVSPETIALMWRWPLGFVGLAVAVAAIMVSVSLYLQHVHGFDRATARLSAIPGNVGYVMALAADIPCDVARLTIIQMMRLGAMVLLMPLVLTMSGIAPATSGGPPRPAVVHPVVAWELVVLLVAGVGGGYAFKWLKLPAPQLFGAMFAAAVLFGSGAFTTGMPAWMLAPAFVVTGAMVGTNFQGMDHKLLCDTLVASIGNVVIGSAVGLAIAWPVASLLGLPVAQLWLAYAPGGVETMAVMALALGFDAAFVGTHHAVRFVLLGTYVPFWVRKLQRRG
jgi:membrane AbrB-like protein